MTSILGLTGSEEFIVSLVPKFLKKIWTWIPQIKNAGADSELSAEINDSINDIYDVVQTIAPDTTLILSGVGVSSIANLIYLRALLEPLGKMITMMLDDYRVYRNTADRLNLSFKGFVDVYSTSIQAINTSGLNQSAYKAISGLLSSYTMANLVTGVDVTGSRLVVLEWVFHRALSYMITNLQWGSKTRLGSTLTTGLSTPLVYTFEFSNHQAGSIIYNEFVPPTASIEYTCTVATTYMVNNDAIPHVLAADTSSGVLPANELQVSINALQAVGTTARFTTTIIYENYQDTTLTRANFPAKSTDATMLSNDIHNYCGWLRPLLMAYELYLESSGRITQATTIEDACGVLGIDYDVALSPWMWVQGILSNTALAESIWTRFINFMANYIYTMSIDSGFHSSNSFRF